MKVLLVHNFYRSGSPGGEDVVFEQDRRLLGRGGHEVHAYTRHNDEMSETSFLDMARTAAGIRFSRRTYRELRRLIGHIEPDVVHCHNTFPLISPSSYLAARDSGVPVVQTVHNYRMVCAAGTHFRAGRVCEECSPVRQSPAVTHACYRGSRAASWVVSRALGYQWAAGTYRELVTRFIALTEFSAGRLVASGIDPSKIAMCPNVVDMVAPTDEVDGERAAEPYAVFMGRLSEEKGLATLLAAWRQSLPWRLKLLGSGPLLHECHRQIETEGLPVDCLGMRTRGEAISILARAKALIVPSLWFEGMPMVILEAWSKGVPVIGSRIGGISEMLRDDRGITFDPGSSDALAQAVRKLAETPDWASQLAVNGSVEYSRKHLSTLGLSRLEAVYAGAIAAVAR